MHVLETLEALVDDVLFVDIFQDVGSNNRVQISVHKVEHKVNISIVLRTNHILKSNNVLVSIQFLQKYYFTESPLGVSCILESIEVFL